MPETDTFLINGLFFLGLQNTTVEYIITVDLDGNLIEGSSKPPSESVLHGEVYRARPDVGAVVHTHQKWATVFGISGRRILPVSHPGRANVVEESLPVYESAQLITSTEQAREVARVLGEHPACHLRNHGVIVVGTNIEEAVYRAVNLEQQAELNFIALQIGKPKSISKEIMMDFRNREDKLLQEKGVNLPNSAFNYYGSLVS